MSRVRIGTCLSSGEAALMRSILAAHGIHAMVVAELAALGTTSLNNDLWVADEDQEEAAILLGVLRDRSAEPAGDLHDTAEAADPGDQDDRASLDQYLDSRRRTGIALLLGLCLTFGTAHMFTRAWLRGIALAAIQTIGFVRLYGGDPAGLALIIFAIAGDLIGALWRIWSARRPALPIARIRSPRQ